MNEQELADFRQQLHLSKNTDEYFRKMSSQSPNRVDYLKTAMEKSGQLPIQPGDKFFPIDAEKNIGREVNSTYQTQINKGSLDTRNRSATQPKNNNPYNRLATPIGKLPMAAGLVGGISQFAGMNDLYEGLQHTKDPVAAYRNWVGVGNQYE